MQWSGSDCFGVDWFPFLFFVCRFGTKIDWWSKLSHMSVVSSKLVFWLKIVCTSSSLLLLVLRSLLVNSLLPTITFSIRANSNQWILIIRSELLFLSRATGVRPTACHPLRSWPAIARAATVSATLRPALAGRAADRYVICTYLCIVIAPYLTYCLESTLVPRSALSYIDRSYRERQASHRPLDPSDLPLFNVFMHHPLGYTNPLGFYP